MLPPLLRDRFSNVLGALKPGRGTPGAAEGTGSLSLLRPGTRDVMLALRPPGRGGLEPGHLNALRMELERSPESRWRGAASRTLLPGEPSAGPSLRTFVSRSDLWPPHPEDPRALPSDSSEVRFCFLTRGLQACGLGPAPDFNALRAQTLTRLPLRARFQFPSLEVAETLFAF